MCTPLEVFVGIAAEGYQISYRRVPMSRERTPQAADLDHLHAQMIGTGRKVAHLFVSRTATGSSARFAATFACVNLHAQEAFETLVAGTGAAALTLSDAVPVPGATSGSDGTELAEQISPASKRLRGGTGPITRHDSEASDLARSAHAGEYRGVMNLCRVLPGGAEAKELVDDAIDACGSIGNIRVDVLKCKEAAEDDAEGGDPSAAAAARRLGLHYLQRYFFLIAFRVYLDSSAVRGPAAVPFSEWVAQRKEITYLLSTLA